MYYWPSIQHHTYLQYFIAFLETIVFFSDITPLHLISWNLLQVYHVSLILIKNKDPQLTA